MSDRVIDSISWAVIIAAVLAFFDPWLDYCNDLISLGISFTALGVLFLVAFFLANRSRALRSLIWISEHSRPAAREMAFFWFVFFVFLGGLALAKGVGLIDAPFLSRGRIAFHSIDTQRTACYFHGIAR